MDKNDNLSEELEELSGDTPEAPEDTEDAENTDELEEADAVSEYNDTATQFSDLEDALAEANDKYLRLFAEYDNYRKRTSSDTSYSPAPSTTTLCALMPTVASAVLNLSPTEYCPAPPFHMIQLTGVPGS